MKQKLTKKNIRKKNIRNIDKLIAYFKEVLGI